MNKKTNKYKFEKEFTYQVTIGLLSNFVVGIISYVHDDRILMNICVLLFILSVLSFVISKFSNLLLGAHLMLVSYFVCFFYAAFTHLASHPLILVYPIILTYAVLYSRNNLIRFLYSVLCLIACTYTVYLQLKYFGSDLIVSDILPSIVITIALMFAFPIIIITNSNRLNLTLEELEDQKLALGQKNEELNLYISSNLQLENFAHLASHELKTPLRNVSNFSSLLSLKAKDKLNEKEADILKIITSEVDKMNGLIEDLLELSIVENLEMKALEIDVNDLIVQLINKHFKEHKTDIKLNIETKTIKGHEELLTQLFLNLIGNAIKFSQNTNDPQIEIKGVEQKEFFQFSIKDNGIGINKEYKDRIFLIFKRLHSHSEYSGSGIGLSICKRIVEKHGGDIWVRDNPEGGCIFEFRLKKY